MTAVLWFIMHLTSTISSRQIRGTDEKDCVWWGKGVGGGKEGEVIEGSGIEKGK